jgi:hypothetical protein
MPAEQQEKLMSDLAFRRGECLMFTPIPAVVLLLVAAWAFGVTVGLLVGIATLLLLGAVCLRHPFTAPTDRWDWP